MRRAEASPAEDPRLDAFWSIDPATVRAFLGAPEGGWSTEGAAAALARHGANRLDAGNRQTWPRLLARQFLNPIEIILIAATILAGALGDPTDAIIILAILMLTGLLGFVRELTAGRAVRALMATFEVTCEVRRGGAATRIPLSAVVPGDVVSVSAGDVIPGDCLVLAANGLEIDESALTGTTFPVEKSPGAVPAASELPARTDAAFLGTHVVSGRGTLLVVRTGRSTRIAAIAATPARTAAQTGFETGMTRFGLLLTRVMIVLVVVILVLNLMLQRPAIDSALLSLALAVGLTPQLLPAIVAIGMSEGARAMARRRVIVRRLDVIGDIGAMTVLCADKTGTMTGGRIELGRVLGIDGGEEPGLAALASLNAGLQTGWRNPIDDAILAAHPLPDGAVAVGELPYDVLRRRQSILTRVQGTADPVLITKGAVDAVREVCTRALTPSGPVPLADAAVTLDRTFAALTAQGFRVLAIATRTLEGSHRLDAADESGLTLVGLVTFADPVKPDASRMLSELTAAGVSVRMVTGDDRRVAAHVAQQVGLDTGTVYTGTDVDTMGDRALACAVDTAEVFCEVNPAQKERIIRAYRRAGHVVGYLGDGMNDAPALHAADVGVTIHTAVAVAAQSAAVVLPDKDLGVLLTGIRLGRRTFANTMKYVFVTTSANFGNMLSVAIAAALLPFLPLLAGQILLVNLVSDLPALTIATDTVDEGQLQRPQHWDVRLIRTYMFVFGALSSVFDLVIFAVLRLGYRAGATEFRSAWLVGSILTEVAVLFILRTRGPFSRSRPGTGLVVTSVLVAVVTVWLPFAPFATALDLVPLGVPLLLTLIGVVLAYLAVNEVVKRVFWRRRDERRA
ncbi:MAG: magnesium-translocating P-type ATPase [Microbacterium sp.]|uniref:magnesium-translocating P-type ATPase n=1 Tax=Microbacterium sp. TaxID=51671 RepID=UPI001ACBF54B|nr:magnesium-translocating P-type ATPase [Microbacterium sp.]MBN9153029.1 magnesium-translocating P-type ATPase [Microbacterium sp.]